MIFVYVDGDRNVCNWQYIKLLIHFIKLLTLLLKMVWSIYCTAEFSPDNEQNPFSVAQMAHKQRRVSLSLP